LAFGRSGYAVAVNFSRDETGAAITVQQLEEIKAESFAVKADVRSSGEVNDMVKKVIGKWGRLDVLVNNAGMVKNRTIFKMTDDEWRDVLAVNLDGAFFCTRAALPIMREQKGGSIVNITSFIANKGIRGAANYAVAKAGLITLTKNTAIEEGSFNIRANAVMPGFHVTDMNEEVWKKSEADIRALHLLKDMPNRDELADFVRTTAELKTVSGQLFPFESRLL